MERRRWPILAAIGTAAGLFSGLFGIGGGTVLVPLLVLWLGFGERRAAATSLAAILPIAMVGVGVHALYGNVHWGAGALIGLPAIAGVVAGTWTQQRLPRRAISLVFSVLLVAAAVQLIVE